MKPLPTAPLTDEDLAIWLNYRGEARRAYGMGWYLSHSREADRRDAELMFDLTSHDYWERDYTRDRVRSRPTAFNMVARRYGR